MTFETISTKVSLSPKQRVQVTNASLTTLGYDHALVVDILNASDLAVDSLVLEVKFVNEVSRYLFDGASFDFSLEGLGIPPQSTYYPDPIVLEDAFHSARGLEVRIKDLVYENGSFWNVTPDMEVSLDLPLVPLEKIDQLQALFGDDVITYAQDYGNFWRCVCGLTLAEATCPYCGRSRDFVLASLKEDQINQKLVSLYVQEEKEEGLSLTQKLSTQKIQDALDLEPYRVNDQVEEEEEAPLRRPSRRQVIYILALALLFLLVTVLLPRSLRRFQDTRRLEEAQDLVQAGYYQEALDIYEDLPRTVDQVDIALKIEDTKNLVWSQQVYDMALEDYESGEKMEAFIKLAAVSPEDQVNYDQAQDLMDSLETDLLNQAQDLANEGDMVHALDLVDQVMATRPSSQASQLREDLEAGS